MDRTYTTRDLGVETAVVEVIGPEETVKCVCLGTNHAEFAWKVVMLLRLSHDMAAAITAGRAP